MKTIYVPVTQKDIDIEKLLPNVNEHSKFTLAISRVLRQRVRFGGAPYHPTGTVLSRRYLDTVLGKIDMADFKLNDTSKPFTMKIAVEEGVV